MGQTRIIRNLILLIIVFSFILNFHILSICNADDMVVTPSTQFNPEGYYPGPYTPSFMTYNVMNQGTQPISVQVYTYADWYSCSPITAIIPPSVSVPFEVTLTSNAFTLSPNYYSDNLYFKNINTNYYSYYYPSLNIKDYMDIKPKGSFYSVGYYGGPFIPSNITYTLINNGEITLTCQATPETEWLSVEPSNIVVPPLGSTIVTVTFNSKANNLSSSLNYYYGTVKYTNTYSNFKLYSYIYLLVKDPMQIEFPTNQIFNGIYGGPFYPEKITYTLTNKGQTPLNYRVLPNQVWLSNTPVSGTLNANSSIPIYVSVNSNANALKPGYYYGSLTFFNDDTNYSYTTYIDLTVDDILKILPDRQFNFEGFAGGPFNNNLKRFLLINNGAAPVPFEIDSQTTWLDITPLTGVIAVSQTLPISFTVNEEANKLVPGSYYSSITVENLNTNYTHQINGNLTVKDPLIIKPESYRSLMGYRGGPFIPDYYTFTLSNRGALPIDYEISYTQNWLGTDSLLGNIDTTGSLEITFTLNENAKKLPTGYKSSSITITNKNINSKQTRTAYLDIQNPPQNPLYVIPSSTSYFHGLSGGPFYPPYTRYYLYNASSKPINYSVNADYDWISPTEFTGTILVSQTIPITFTLNSNVLQLPPRSYDYWNYLYFEDTDTGLYQTRNISLQVNPDNMLINPTYINYSTGYYGGPFNPITFTYQVSNITDHEFPFEVTSSADWLFPQVMTSSLPVTMPVDVSFFIDDSAKDLLPGEHKGVLSFYNPETGRTQTRTIEITVNDPIDINPKNTIEFRGYEGGPFTPNFFTYTLSNNGDQPYEVDIQGDKDWLDTGFYSETIPPHSIISHTVALSEAVNTLRPGWYESRLSFTNIAISHTQNRWAFVNVQNPLDVLPNTQAIINGPYLGEYDPEAVVYFMSNYGNYPVNYQVRTSFPWLEPNYVTGTLPVSSTQAISFTLTEDAKFFPDGIYRNTILFFNTNNGFGYEKVVYFKNGIHDYFTEYFGNSDNDLRYHQITFMPDGSKNYYRACCKAYTSSTFPTDPAGGATLNMTTDGFRQITWVNPLPIYFYGKGYNTLFVGSNGYVTFDRGDTNSSPSIDSHFAFPRIAGLFYNFYEQAADSEISWKELPDRIAITYKNVYYRYNKLPCNFQIEIFFNGKIVITYLEVKETGGLAGLSEGKRTPSDFFESDLTTYSNCEPFSNVFVDPLLNFRMRGFEGGPFFPSFFTYNLSNWSGNTFTTTLDIENGWLGADPLTLTLPGAYTDTIPPTATISITVTIPVTTTFSYASKKNSMKAGFYNNKVTFNDPSTGNNPSHNCVLGVYPNPGNIIVSDSIPPAFDKYMPFGEVQRNKYYSGQITIKNISENNNLTISNIFLGKLYFESFNDGQAQGWVPENSEYWQVLDGPGEYRASGQKTTTPMMLQSTYKGEKWKDAAIEASIRRIGYLGSGAGVFFRATDDFSFNNGTGSAYFLLINANYSYLLGKVVNGTIYQLTKSGWTSSYYLFKEYKWNTISLEIEGSTIYIYFNGMFVYKITETSIINSGFAGLLSFSGDSNNTSKADNYFDNVKIKNVVTQTVLPKLNKDPKYKCETEKFEKKIELSDIFNPKFNEKGIDDLTKKSSSEQIIDENSIKGPGWDMDGFSLSGMPNFPYNILPFQELTFTVGFKLPNLGYYKDSVIIESNDTNARQVTVILDARIVDEESTGPIKITKPAKNDEISTGTYEIRWTDYVPYTNALISLFYDNNSVGYDGNEIVSGINEDDSANKYLWDTSVVPEGIYYIYGKIDDSINEPKYNYSEGTVKVTHIKKKDLLDYFLGTGAFDMNRLIFADFNNDGKVDIADLIWFINRQ